MTTAASWKFDCITDWETIWSESFQKQWMEWMETDTESHIFFHPALVKAWVETYLPLRRLEPRFLVARQGESTVFLPLVLWRRNWKNAWQRLLIPAGYSDFDYHDPIRVGPANGSRLGDFWSAFIGEISAGTETKNVDRLLLPGLRTGATADGSLVETGETCLACQLEDYPNSEAFLSSLKRSVRHAIRRQIRRMNEQGPLHYRVYDADQEDSAMNALPLFLKAHARRWPRAYRAPGLHAALLREGLRAGVAHFSELRVGDQPISWRFVFFYKRRLYSYISAFLENYAILSPSTVHRFFCLQYALEKKKALIYDLLRGDENYKHDWADHSVPLYALHWKSDGLGSRLRNGWVEVVKPRTAKLVRQCVAPAIAQESAEGL